MAKAYWVASYREVRDPDKLAANARLAGRVFVATGGRVLARDVPAQVYESGVRQRLVLIEFDSVEQAVAARDGADYQAALAILGDSVDRLNRQPTDSCRREGCNLADRFPLESSMHGLGGMAACFRNGWSAR
jgi:uncharacterized protein (DUF1330 family)